MKKFIIVGKGLAAACLMHQFHKHKIDFVCIGNGALSQSSKVAGGIWNPVVFKRMTSSWMAETLIPSLYEFYTHCEALLSVKLLTERHFIKPFTEDQEKRLWEKKAVNELDLFLDAKFYDPTEAHQQLKIKNQFGLVQKAGNVDLPLFLEATSNFFKAQIMEETFDYGALQITENGVKYKNIEAEHIVFCEGYLVKNNPYFDWIPLVPAKGETLTVTGLQLKLNNFIFNKDGFIMDLGNNTYKVGATYEWNELNDQTTEKGLLSLTNKIKQMTDADYQIMKQEAGVRPSSRDRRPIVGTHPVHKQLHVFNGLGSKGVMLAPFFSENFVYFYLQKQLLHQEIDVKRFYHLYGTSTKK